MLLVVHAGAGDHPQSTEPALLAALEAAARAGWAILTASGTAAEAVTAAVASLETYPDCNAGVDGALTWDGVAEADASLADGDGAGGGVGAVAGLTSPIAVAAALAAERAPARGGLTRPTLLCGDGAREWAVQKGLAAAPDAASARTCNVTAGARARWAAWRRAVEEEAGEGAPACPPTDTVGAVAIDAHGRSAAASSSGGAPLRPSGRVGSAAILGAGVAAIDARVRRCGVPPAAAAATGVGEAVMRHRVAAAALDAVRSPAGGQGVAAVVRCACERESCAPASAPAPGVGVVAIRGGGTRSEIVVCHGAAALPFAVACGEGAGEYAAADGGGRVCLGEVGRMKKNVTSTTLLFFLCVPCVFSIVPTLHSMLSRLAIVAALVVALTAAAPVPLPAPTPETVGAPPPATPTAPPPRTPPPSPAPGVATDRQSVVVAAAPKAHRHRGAAAPASARSAAIDAAGLCATAHAWQGDATPIPTIIIRTVKPGPLTRNKTRATVAVCDTHGAVDWSGDARARACAAAPTPSAATSSCSTR